MLLALLYVQCYFWFLCLAGLLYYIYSRRKLYWLSWQLPGPNPALPLVGNCLVLCYTGIMNIFPLLDKIMNSYRCGMVRIWLGPYMLVLLYDPGVVYQVNKKTQTKSTEYQYLAKPFLDRGLFLSNDMEHWRQSKKTFLLALSSENLKSFIPKFHEECLRVVDTFGKYCAQEQNVHTTRIFSNLAVCCIVKCTMGFDFHTRDETEKEDFVETFETVMEFFQLRLMVPPLRNSFFYSLVGLRAKEMNVINACRKHFESILNNYKEKKLKSQINKVTKNEKLFIEHLLDEEEMSEDEMIAHMATMIVGGTDTLATESTMLLILLAQNPLVQEKLHDELVQVLGADYNSCPTVEDLNKLEYLDRVLKECLRIFPAAPYIGRCASKNITVTGSDGKDYNIPEGASLVIGIRNIQNNPLYYDNPNEFDPDRWLQQNVEKRTSWSYLPFNNGPRNCLGARYALLQIKTMAATVLRAFEIHTSKSCEKFEDIHVKMSMTVKIESNCQVVFKKRIIN